MGVRFRRATWPLAIVAVVGVLAVAIYSLGDSAGGGTAHLEKSAGALHPSTDPGSESESVEESTPQAEPAPQSESDSESVSGGEALEGWQSAIDSRDISQIREWYEANTGVTGLYDPELDRQLLYEDLEVYDAGGGYLESTYPGQVIERLDVINTQGLLIRHPDVTIRAVRIVPSNEYDFSVVLDQPDGGFGDGITLEYVTIDGLSQSENIAGTIWNTTVRHLHLRGHRSGFHLGGDVTIEDSYIHSQVITPDSHNTAVSNHGGGQNITLRRNFLEGSTSSALSLYPDNGPLSDHTIENNIFDGNDASYSVYGGCTDSKFYGQDNERIVFRDNFFLPGRHGNAVWQCTSPRWGPGHVWTGNRHLVSGESIP